MTEQRAWLVPCLRFVTLGIHSIIPVSPASAEAEPELDRPVVVVQPGSDGSAMGGPRLHPVGRFRPDGFYPGVIQCTGNVLVVRKFELLLVRGASCCHLHGPQPTVPLCGTQLAARVLLEVLSSLQACQSAQGGILRHLRSSTERAAGSVELSRQGASICESSIVPEYDTMTGR